MEPERQEYKGHRIELREPEADFAAEPQARLKGGADLDLLIDDQPVRYGQLPDGRYALEEYAFDWRDNLMDLAQRFIDYRERAEEVRREAESSEEN